MLNPLSCMMQFRVPSNMKHYNALNKSRPRRVIFFQAMSFPFRYGCIDIWKMLTIPANNFLANFHILKILGSPIRLMPNSRWNNIIFLTLNCCTQAFFNGVKMPSLNITKGYLFPKALFHDKKAFINCLDFCYT